RRLEITPCMIEGGVDLPERSVGPGTEPLAEADIERGAAEVVVETRRMRSVDEAVVLRAGAIGALQQVQDVVEELRSDLAVKLPGKFKAGVRRIAGGTAF